MRAIWSPAPQPAAPAPAETGGTDEAAMRAAIGGLGAAGRASLAGAFALWRPVRRRTSPSISRRDAMRPAAPVS
jgi:hypothetical protein